MNRAFQFNDYKQIESRLTGRKLIVNGSNDCFLISPLFDSAPIPDAIAAFQTHNEKLKVKNSGALSDRLMKQVSLLAECSSPQTFATGLVTLIDAIEKNLSQGKGNISGPARFTDLLVCLYAANLLIFPRHATFLFGRRIHLHKWWKIESVTHLRRIAEEFHEANVAYAETHSSRQSTTLRLRMFHEVMFSTGGLTEIGDLTPEVIDKRLAIYKNKGRHHYGRATATFLTKILGVRYPDHEPAIAIDDYGPYGRYRKRADSSFSWATQEEPQLESWRSIAEAWLKTQTRSFGGKRSVLNGFFDALLQDRTVPREPLEMLRSSYVLPVLPGINDDTNRQCARSRAILADFLDWILDTQCVAEDDHGFPVRLPGFRNPVVLIRQRSNKFETHREALPTRYVRILKEILEENDFAWARALDNPKSRKADLFSWHDPETGDWRQMWSPVRVMAILLKLELPLRTHQVRVLNSGEADYLRYDRHTNQWTKSNHALANLDPRSAPMGVLRRIHDSVSNGYFIGLYINTNKTKDANACNDDRGYVIPWQNWRVIEILATLREWQEKFNPIKRALPWSEITEHVIAESNSPAVLERKGAETFLFRDPASKHPEAPVAINRLHIFWLRLCAELERRLQILGETGPDGKPVRLVRRNEAGSYVSSVYDLHGLRVTLITALAENGVPVEYLMKLAGHCTAIMTIYYKKFPISHVTEVLDEAKLAIARNEQANWERHVKSKAFDQLKSIVAFNDVTGLQALSAGTGASWIRSDIGICPVGGNRCSDGGEPVISSAGAIRYGPVPGGQRNCVRCRFFITGPAFLIGLQAHVNYIGLQVKECSRKFMDAQAEYLRLDTQRQRAYDRKDPFDALKDWQIASATFEQYTQEVDQIALTWHASYNLFEQCKTLLHDKDGALREGEFALVVNGTEDELKFVLESDERGEREFELLDSVCQHAVWFRSINANVANLRRMRLFDAMLMRNGHDAAFAQMSDADAMQVGNEIAKFMYTQYRRDDVNAVVSGEKALRDLGIDAEKNVLEKLEQIAAETLAGTARFKALGAARKALGASQ